MVPGQFSGALKPDYVIPFKLSKDDAIAALKKHYKGKPFLPKAFTKGNHIQEIKGVYVPFWMFNGRAEGHVEFEGLISHVHTEGDYEVTTTEHYDVRRGGDIAFEKVPVDASSKMPDDHMDSIEPYNYKDLKPFSHICRAFWRISTTCPWRTVRSGPTAAAPRLWRRRCAARPTCTTPASP